MRIFCFLLCLTFALSCQQSPAQCPSDTLFFVDFQDQQIPNGWTNLDRDSLNDQSGRPADWFIAPDPISNPTPPNYVVASNSWFAPAGTADNWLITEAVAICDSNLFLTWRSAPFEGPVYLDGYEVLLSTSTPDPDSFAISLQRFAEGIDATNQTSSGTIHSAYAGNRGLLQSWRAALLPWFGDTVYLAFHHQSTDDNLIQLDDIGVVRIPDYDAQTTALSYSTEYPIVPLSQIQAMNYSATVTNEGAADLNNLVFDLRATVGGQTAFTATDSIANLPVGSNSVFSPPTPFLPQQIDTYTLTATVATDSIETDSFPSNNVRTLNFTVSDSVYARDEGPVAGLRNLSNGGFLGQAFRIAAADTLTSISFYLENPSGFDTLIGAVYQLGSSPGTLLAQTDPWPVPPNFSGWATVGLAGIDLPISGGAIIVGLNQPASGQVNLGWTAEKTSPAAGWHQVAGDWATTDALDLPGTYMIRANFGTVDEVVAAEPIGNAQELRIAPNPSPGQFHLEFSRPISRASLLEVHDLTGRKLQSLPVPAGRAQADIDLARAPAGLYLLRAEGRTLGRLNVVR
ncbi:MAG: choice-of-anchor J domain-containing protein [Bacteroidota bacterium]